MGIFIGHNDNKPTIMKMEAFLRHAICLGSTGSGKTVGAKVICEEFSMSGIPIIAIDPQGDVAGLSIPGGSDDPETQELINQYEETTDVVLWTPGSNSGIPLTFNPIDVEAARRIKDKEIKEDVIARMANGITSILDYDLTSELGRTVASAFNITLEHIVNFDKGDISFQKLGEYIIEPPESVKGTLDFLLGEKKAKEVQKRLFRLSIGPNKRLFTEGKNVNIPRLLGLDGTGIRGKTRISVISTNILNSSEQKKFVVAQIAESLYRWMITNIEVGKDETTTPIRAVLYIDEVHDHLPPSNKKKPMSKDPLEKLLREARKFGVCVLLASQNPGDLDYKCLGQINTWFVGKISEKQSLAKLAKAIESKAHDETDHIMESLPSLEHEFMIMSPSFQKVLKHKFRWLYTRHGVPFSKTLIEEMVTNEQRTLMGLETKVKPQVAKPEIKEIAKDIAKEDDLFDIKEFLDSQEEKVIDKKPIPYREKKVKRLTLEEIEEMEKIEFELKETLGNSPRADILKSRLLKYKQKICISKLGG